MRNNVLAAALLVGAASLSAAAPGYPTRPEGDQAGAPAATTASSNTIVATRTVAHACAEVSASWAAQIVASPKATPTVGAALAHECLKSVPLHAWEAGKLIDSLVPYLEWQSDAAYKKDPPEGYHHPGFDIFANLAKVKDSLNARKYKSEYAFQTDLYETVFAPGQDGHYLFYPDALARAFKWRRDHSLVSISEDGKSLPVIKLYEDVTKDPKTARAVVKINGIDASKYVENTVSRASVGHDRDAAYNTMFYSKAGGARGGGYFSGGGRIDIIYQGPTTTFTFADGDELTVENKAKVIGNMTGVVDGESFYSVFCKPQKPRRPAKKSYSLVEYPKPIVSTSDGVLSGHYLGGDGFDEVAVLVVKSFKTDMAGFQAVMQDFIRLAKADGKTRLIVDLQANGGGYDVLSVEIFRQLFPQIQEKKYYRCKQNTGVKGIARVYSDATEDFDPGNFDEEEDPVRYMYLSRMNYRSGLNLTMDKFATFEDKFAPHIHRGSEYTALVRDDYNDPVSTWNSGIEVTGYGSRSNMTQPFKAEDIVLLHDGACSSACAGASEMLIAQGGVKSVVFGGRPREGPMQGIGGIKGAQALEFSSIRWHARNAARRTDDSEIRYALQDYWNYPIWRSTVAVVNSCDWILPGNVNDGLPAQYVTRHADCRLYWTAPMISDVAEVWKAAANAAFNGASCAHGGLQ